MVQARLSTGHHVPLPAVITVALSVIAVNSSKMVAYKLIRPWDGQFLLVWQNCHQHLWTILQSCRGPIFIALVLHISPDHFLLQLFGWAMLPVKVVSEMTYCYVSGGTRLLRSTSNLCLFKIYHILN